MIPADARRWRQYPAADVAISALIICVPVAIVAMLVEASRIFGAGAVEPVLGAVTILFAWSSQGRWSAVAYAVVAGWLIHG